MLWLTVSRTVCLHVKPQSMAQDQIFVTVRQLQLCSCEVSFVTRGWGCHLQLLLTLASTIILRSKSHGTHDYIWSVGQLNCCWPSPAQSFLVSVSSRSMTKIFILYMYMIQNGASFYDEGGVSISMQVHLMHHSFSMSIPVLSQHQHC
jgi:hypothetical protein